MWQTIVKLDRPQMTIWNMHVVCWMTKATHTRARARARTHAPRARARTHARTHAERERESM